MVLFAVPLLLLQVQLDNRGLWLPVLYCDFISGVIYSALNRYENGFRNSLNVSLMLGSSATCFAVPVCSSLTTQEILSLTLLSNSVFKFASLNSRI